MTFFNLFRRVTRQRLITGARAGLLSGFAVVSLNAGCSMDLQAIKVADRTTPPSRLPLRKPDFEDNSGFQELISTVRREAGRSHLYGSHELTWDTAARSAGGRPIETLTIGSQGYRTLILGSVGGNDAKAIELVEKLAEHLNEQRLILDGFQTTIVRTLNPDGRASSSFFNKAGVYINHDFPVVLTPALRASARPRTSGTQPETNFLLSTLNGSDAPERVIHVRSIAEQTGVVGASRNADQFADELAEWLNYDRLSFPENAAEGTLEKMISSESRFEIITLAIPRAPIGETWSTCRDPLVSLLVPDDSMSDAIQPRRRPAPVATSETEQHNRFRRPALRAPTPSSNPDRDPFDTESMFDED